MNKDVEFIKYDPTPSEKHMGIATIKLYGRIILRYKIVPNKDGTGFFAASASYKMPGTDDQYISAFTLDSVSEKEEVDGFIRSNVKRFLTCHQSPVFDDSKCPF